MPRDSPLATPGALLRRFHEPISKVRPFSGQEAWLLTR